MFFSILLLAISCSIDSFGIGVSYGCKKTKLKNSAKLILFVISFAITIFSFIIGLFFRNIFSEGFFKLIGSVILIIMGLLIILKKENEDFNFDLDNSNDIDNKEALFLGVALSLDSFCIGIGAFAFGMNMFLFAILVACLQFLFLSLGNCVGISITNSKFFSQNLLTKISGVVLILIGILKI